MGGAYTKDYSILGFLGSAYLGNYHIGFRCIVKDG